MAADTERTVTHEATAMLVGRRVVRVGYLPRAEAADLGWQQRPAYLLFDDGTMLYAACDEAENDAGVLMVVGKKSELCLGRLPA